VKRRLWEELGLGEFLARKVRSEAGLSSPVARIPIGRMIVVSDRGTVSEENLKLSVRTWAFLHRRDEGFQAGRWPWRVGVHGG